MADLAQNRLSIWLSAIRLRTLPLSVAGIVTGSALAYRIAEFKIGIFIPAIFTTLFLQILSNLANDLGDAEKGSDGAERIGPKRMVQSGMISIKSIKSAIYLVTGLALVSGIILLYTAFGSENFSYAIVFFIIGILAIWSAIKYTIGKKAYGYNGLGDVFVIAFFGFISVAGSFMLYTHIVSISSILQSITIGTLSAGVLHLNNMRDLESDRKSGKNTIAVKLGAKKSKLYFYFLIFIGIFSTITESTLYSHHFTEFLHLLIVIPAFLISNKIANVVNPETYNNYLKPLALTTFCYSILLFVSYSL